jgi:hypothetical protein
MCAMNLVRRHYLSADINPAGAGVGRKLAVT